MRRAILVSILLCASGGVLAQRADSLSGAATVSLLTMLPGDEVYSQFGHSGYRVHDPATGLDKTYNYGTFDFTHPFFIARFIRGKLDYMLDTAPYHLEREKYAYLRRPMIEQRLALPLETKQSLFELLETNALPENRAYRYDFFFDNCSTRLLDILDEALVSTGHMGLVLPSPVASESFRELTTPYISDTPLLRFGIGLGLGLPSDREATSRQRSFLPVELMHQFDGATFDGQRLVAATDTVVVVQEYAGERAAFDWPTLATWLLSLGGLAATLFGFSQRKIGSVRGRRGDQALFAITGLAGCTLALLWFGTEHAVTGPNLNLFWAWPTHVLAAWWLRKPTLPGWIRGYLLVAALVALAMLLLWRVLPQALPTAALPIVLLLSVRSFARFFIAQQSR